MNIKILLLIMLSINIAFLLTSFVCDRGVGGCPELSSSLVNELFNMNQVTDLTQTGVPGLTDEFAESIESSTVPQSSGVTAGAVDAFNLLDGLKMILGLIVLLTPLPFIDIFGSLGLPIFIGIIFVVGFVILFVISLLETIRGAPAGSR